MVKAGKKMLASGIDSDKAVDHAKQWIEAVTGRRIHNMYDELRGGELLCR